MVQLSSIGNRIAEKRRLHDAKAEAWEKRLDVLDATEPAVFAVGDVIIEERAVDLKQFESDMRMMSNFGPVADAAAVSVAAGYVLCLLVDGSFALLPRRFFWRLRLFGVVQKILR